MPSGFQQDSNQLAPGFYRVVLTMGAGTATWNAASPANGAVNPYNWDSYSTKPSSDANGQRLARGNMRFQFIIEELTKYADGQILDLEVTSSDTTDANSVPSALAFTVKYDRDAFVLPGVTGVASSFTPTTGGAVTIDTTAKAIRYLVGQALARDAYTKKYNTYNVTGARGELQSITVNKPDALADLYDDVTVTVLDGTELTSTV